MRGGAGEPCHVAMFVYNNCTTDARVLKEAASLATAGLDVKVIAVLDPTTPSEEAREGFEITRIERNPVHYQVLRAERQAAVFGAPVAPLRRRLRRALRRVHKPLMFLDYYVRAYRLLRGERLDIVHAHDLNTLPVAAAVARAHGARLVYDSHELYTEVSTLSARERRIWRIVERSLIHRADQVVTVCESISKELVNRYAVPPPVVLLNCPLRPAQARVNRDQNPLRAKTGLQDSPEPIVLYQGGFAPHRGLPTLVEAARAFDRGILVLMGWGTLAEELSRLIDRLQLRDRVVITDPVPQEELLSYTAGADVGVIPYKAVGLNNYYSTPNKLFEYIAAGVPIVSSRFPELARFVEGLDVGRTFDPDRADDLAAAVNFVLADPVRRQGMCERALHAADRLNWENEAEKLFDLYGVRPAPLKAPGACAVTT